MNMQSGREELTHAEYQTISNTDKQTYDGCNFNFGNAAVNFWYSTPTEFIFSQTLDVLPKVM